MTASLLPFRALQPPGAGQRSGSPELTLRWLGCSRHKEGAHSSWQGTGPQLGSCGLTPCASSPPIVSPLSRKMRPSILHQAAVCQFPRACCFSSLSPDDPLVFSSPLCLCPAYSRAFCFQRKMCRKSLLAAGAHTVSEHGLQPHTRAPSRKCWHRPCCSPLPLTTGPCTPRTLAAGQMHTYTARDPAGSGVPPLGPQKEPGA